VFHEIDADSKGYIDAEDLKGLAAELKERFSEE